jgi:hypothetical protein
MRLASIAAIAATALAVTAGPAAGAQHTVDNDSADCPAAEYTSIQAAVTAAEPGDTIRVCAGTYEEQVEIPAGKDELKLFSTPKHAAVIKAPPTMTGPGNVVHVNGARDVSIDRFVISGPFEAPNCAGTRVGVRVGGGGSASLADNHITEMRNANPALRNCQNVLAVLIGRRSEGDVGQAELHANVIDRYQKAGVVVDNAGSFAELDQNRIEGDGPNPTIAQNGIQISREADADAHKNIVLDNSFSGTTAASSGILPFETTGLEIRDNYIARNDVNIYADSFVVPPLTNSVIEKNEVLNGVYDGIFMDADTAGNVLRLNFLRGNGIDCDDISVGPGTGGTANFWLKNDGVTDNRGGALCSPKGGNKPGKQKEPNRRRAPDPSP